MHKRQLFERALREADKGDVELGATDWAVAVGLAQDFGHGLEWEDFTKTEAVARIEAYAEAMNQGEEE